MVKGTRKKGSVALQTLIGGGALTVLLFVFIGYFVYLYPRYTVEMHVQNLSTQVKLAGRLEQNVYKEFVDEMETLGYGAYTVEDGLYVYTKGNSVHPDGTNLIERVGYTPPISQRGDGWIAVHFVVPAEVNQLERGLGFFDALVPDGMKEYHIQRTVASEAVSYE